MLQGINMPWVNISMLTCFKKKYIDLAQLNKYQAPVYAFKIYLRHGIKTIAEKSPNLYLTFMGEPYDWKT